MYHKIQPLLLRNTTIIRTIPKRLRKVVAVISLLMLRYRYIATVSTTIPSLSFITTLAAWKIPSSLLSLRNTKTKLIINSHIHMIMMSSSTAIEGSTSPTSIPDTMKCIVYGSESGIVQEEIRSTKNIRDVIHQHNIRKQQTQNQQFNIKYNHMIVVKVHAVGLNPVDAKEVIGDKIPRSFTHVRNFLKHKFVKNNIIGFEFSGIVISSSYTNNNIIDNSSSSKNVDKTTDDNTLKPYGIYNEGDYVFGTVPPFHGTLAEYIIVPYDQICHMPLYYYNINDNNDNDVNNDITTNSTSPDTDTTTTTTSTTTTSNNNNINTLQRYPLHFYQAACMPLVYLTIYQCLHEYIDQHKNKVQSILIIGGSGGTGHIAIMMAKYIWNIQHITTICSKRNMSFCYQLGATNVIPYDDEHNANNDDDDNNNIPYIIQSLQKSMIVSYDIVMDCVTSDDPRDHNLSYPSMLQNPLYNHLLSNDYIYRRLGGHTGDWIRAGLERTIIPSSSSSNIVWKNSHEKLFWIKFPHSSQQLYQLYEWMMTMKPTKSDDDKGDDDDNNNNDKIKPNDNPSFLFLKPPIIEKHYIYPFTKDGVENAFSALLSRRVRGKVVIEVIPSSSTTSLSISSSN